MFSAIRLRVGLPTIDGRPGYVRIIIIGMEGLGGGLNINMCGGVWRNGQFVLENETSYWRVPYRDVDDDDMTLVGFRQERRKSWFVGGSRI
jgi:hypothetical protein